MTIGWLAYAWIATALAGLAALLLERGLRAAGLQARGVWVVAAIAAVGLGLDAWPKTELASPTLMNEGAAPLPNAELATGVTSDASGRAAVQVALPAAPAGTLHFIRDDILRRPVPGAAMFWLAGSLVLVGAWLTQTARLHRRRRRWPEVRVDGVTVLVSGDVGPAALGLIRGRVVLPRWTLKALPSDSLRMVVDHEEEHLRAGDVPLLGAVGLLVAAMPWNLPLWWHARRLRAAVELDCDLRMVRRGVDRGAYGHLLVAMAGADSPIHAGVPAFGGRPQLTMRIEMLTAISTGSRWSAVLPALAAILVVLAACGVPSPAAPLISEKANATVQALLDLRPTEVSAWIDVSQALAAEPWLAESDGVVAVMLEPGADGRGARVELAAQVGRVPVEAIEAVVRALGQPEFRVAGPVAPGGAAPVWVLLAPDRVEVHLASLEMYQRSRFLNDGAALRDQMESYRQLAGRPEAPGISNAVAVSDAGRRGAGASGNSVLVLSKADGRSMVMAGDQLIGRLKGAAASGSDGTAQPKTAAGTAAGTAAATAAGATQQR